MKSHSQFKTLPNNIQQKITRLLMDNRFPEAREIFLTHSTAATNQSPDDLEQQLSA